MRGGRILSLRLGSHCRTPSLPGACFLSSLAYLAGGGGEPGPRGSFSGGSCPCGPPLGTCCGAYWVGVGPGSVPPRLGADSPQPASPTLRPSKGPESTTPGRAGLPLPPLPHLSLWAWEDQGQTPASFGQAQSLCECAWVSVRDMCVWVCMSL